MVPPDEVRQLRMIKQLNAKMMQRLTLNGVLYMSLGLILFFFAVALEAGPLIGVPAVFMIVGIWLLSLRLRLARKLMKRAMPLLNQILTYRVDDEGVTQRGAISSTTYYWAGISAVVETGEFWFIRVGKLHAMTLPRQFVPPMEAAVIRGAFVQRGLLPAAPALV